MPFYCKKPIAIEARQYTGDVDYWEPNDGVSNRIRIEALVWRNV